MSIMKKFSLLAAILSLNLLQAEEPKEKYSFPFEYHGGNEAPWEEVPPTLILFPIDKAASQEEIKLYGSNTSPSPQENPSRVKKHILSSQQSGDQQEG